jgi:hypothetical protein
MTTDVLEEVKKEEEPTEHDRLIADFANGVLSQIFTDLGKDATFNSMLNKLITMTVSVSVAYAIQQAIEFAQAHPEIYEEYGYEEHS